MMTGRYSTAISDDTPDLIESELLSQSSNFRQSLSIH